MAKFKKTAKKSAGRKSTGGKAAGGADARSQAEALSKTISESAQQIWLAGVGALGRAQSEGTRLFEGLVREGSNFERNARQFAGDGADAMKGAVGATVGQARERATDTWDRLEKVFEDRVQRALVKLGVPGREDLRELSRRVDALTAELRRQNGGGARATKRAPAKKAGTKTAKKAVKPPAKKAAKAPARKRAPRKAASAATAPTAG